MLTTEAINQTVNACYEWANQNNVQLSDNITDPNQVTLKITPFYPGDGIPNVWVSLFIPALSDGAWLSTGYQFGTELIGNGVNTVSFESAKQCLNSKLAFAKNRLMTNWQLKQYADHNQHVVNRQDLRC